MEIRAPGGVSQPRAATAVRRRAAESLSRAVTYWPASVCSSRRVRAARCMAATLLRKNSRRVSRRCSCASKTVRRLAMVPAKVGAPSPGSSGRPVPASRASSQASTPPIRSASGSWRHRAWSTRGLPWLERRTDSGRPGACDPRASAANSVRSAMLKGPKMTRSIRPGSHGAPSVAMSRTRTGPPDSSARRPARRARSASLEVAADSTSSQTHSADAGDAPSGGVGVRPPRRRRVASSPAQGVVRREVNTTGPRTPAVRRYQRAKSAAVVVLPLPTGPWSRTGRTSSKIRSTVMITSSRPTHPIFGGTGSGVSRGWATGSGGALRPSPAAWCVASNRRTG